MSNDTNVEQPKELSKLDKLDLRNVQIPEIPADIIFPNELNQYLRDQVHYLCHENGMLKKNLSECEIRLKESESKLDSLQSQVKDYQDACKNGTYISASNLASAKIVELSKKLREKNAEVEVLKTRCSKLEMCLHKVEEQKKTQIELQENVSEKAEKPLSETEDQIKSLQDKLNSTSNKLFETKNLNIQLKNDLKLANKLLQQEIGENFETLQSLVNSNGNWRGRSQIIRDLQQKNNELKDKLKVCQSGSHIAPTESYSQMKLEQRIENVTKENTELKSNLEMTKKKLDAARARCKYYDTEICQVKAKLNATIEQNDRDQHLIETLTAQLTSFRDSQGDLVKQKQCTINKLEQDNKNLKLELDKERCKSNNYQKQIHEKEAEIEAIMQKHKRFSPHTIPVYQNNNIIDEKLISRLEAEKQRLLELTEVCNKRLEAERNAHTNTQNQFRLERQRAAKLEAKVARMQLEQHTERSTTYTSYSSQSKMSDNNIEDQLELAKENIKALQTRLQIEQQERKLDFAEFAKILQNRTEYSGTN